MQFLDEKRPFTHWQDKDIKETFLWIAPLVFATIQQENLWHTLLAHFIVWKKFHQILKIMNLMYSAESFFLLWR